MCKAQGCFDVLGLSTLVATSQKDDQLSAAFLEVHPVTRTIVDSQFRHTFTNWFDITGIP
jgi:hypothetical protein